MIRLITAVLMAFMLIQFIYSHDFGTGFVTHMIQHYAQVHLVGHSIPRNSLGRIYRTLKMVIPHRQNKGTP